MGVRVEGAPGHAPGADAERGERARERTADPAFDKKIEEVEKAFGFGPVLSDAQKKALSKVGNTLFETFGSGQREQVEAVHGKLISLATSVNKARAARADWKSVDTRPFREAIQAMGDLGMPAEERGRLIREALGPSLTDAGWASLKSVAQLVPEGTFATAGAVAQRHVGADKEVQDEVRHRWWGTFVPRDLEATGQALDDALGGVHHPEFRSAIDMALNVVRVAAAVEAPNLERIAVQVPEAERPAVRQAIRRYGISVSKLLFSAVGGDELTNLRDSEAMGTLIDALLRASDGEGAGPAEKLAQLEAAWTAKGGVAERLRALAAHPERLQLGKPFFERLDALSAELRDELSKHVETTPEGRQALTELTSDVRACAVVLGNAVRMFGAVSNTQMKDEERSEVIKSSAEDMGPLYVKLLQTAVNQEALLGSAVKGEDHEAGPVLKALRGLQDRVTPMPFEQVRQQIRAAFGKELEDVFVEFDPEPIGSASIAQTHRAKIHIEATPWSKARDEEVVVKVQRPGLEAEFDATIRVARLTMAVASQVLEMMKDKAPEERKAFGQGLVLLDNTLKSFIESFRVETDFVHEAEQMKEASRDLRAHPYVAIPRVLDSLTTKTVLTMQYMRGQKLRDWLSRYERAREARKAPADIQPLPTVVGREERAEAKARLWASQHFGLEPSSLELTPSGDGYRAQIRFSEGPQRESELVIRQDGTLHPVGNVPDLSDDGVQQLRDRLLAVFLDQLFHGLVHGDLHQANFLIMPDGKTIALLDFGLVIRLGLKDFTSPAKLIAGWIRGDFPRIATAIIDMSEQGPSLAKADRDRLQKQLIETITPKLVAAESRLDGTELLAAVAQASAENGLSLAPKYLQLIKTSLAMSGNITIFGASDVRGGIWKGARRITGAVLGSGAARVSPHGFAIEAVKKRRVKKLNRQA